MQTELGQWQPEASGSHYITSSVRTSEAFNGIQTSNLDFWAPHLSPSAELLRTNRPVQINDEFRAHPQAPWVDALFKVTA